MKTILIYGLIKIILFIIAIPVSFKIERNILIEKDQEIIKLKKLLKEAVEEKQRIDSVNQGLIQDLKNVKEKYFIVKQISEDARLNNIRSCCQSPDTLPNAIDLQNAITRNYINSQMMDTQSNINTAIANLKYATYPIPHTSRYPYMNAEITNSYTRYAALPQMMPPEMIMAAAILHTPYGR